MLITFLLQGRSKRKIGVRDFGFRLPNGNVVHIKGRRIIESPYSEFSDRDPSGFPLNNIFDPEKIQIFFLENWRNYALFKSGVSAIIRSDVEYFTQPIKLPILRPIDDEMHLERWRSLEQQIQKGDLLCTFDCESNMSKMISWVTSGPWSHVAACSGEGMVLEMITTGSCERSLEVYRQKKYRVGLYRLMVPNLDFDKAFESARESLGQSYGYPAIILSLIETIIGRTQPSTSPNDLAMHRDFRLIGIV